METGVLISELTKPHSFSNSNGSWRRCVALGCSAYLTSFISSQINAFYLQKEAELKLRLETLLSKRRAAAMRGFPTLDDPVQNHVEWSAVEEGFRLLERDLGKLQVHSLTCLYETYAHRAISSNSSR